MTLPPTLLANRYTPRSISPGVAACESTVICKSSPAACILRCPPLSERAGEMHKGSCFWRNVAASNALALLPPTSMSPNVGASAIVRCSAGMASNLSRTTVSTVSRDRITSLRTTVCPATVHPLSVDPSPHSAGNFGRNQNVAFRTCAWIRGKTRVQPTLCLYSFRW